MTFIGVVIDTVVGKSIHSIVFIVIVLLQLSCYKCYCCYCSSPAKVRGFVFLLEPRVFVYIKCAKLVVYLVAKVCYKVKKLP